MVRRTVCTRARLHPLYDLSLSGLHHANLLDCLCSRRPAISWLDQTFASICSLNRGCLFSSLVLFLFSYARVTLLTIHPTHFRCVSQIAPALAIALQSIDKREAMCGLTNALVVHVLATMKKYRRSITDLVYAYDEFERLFPNLTSFRYLSYFTRYLTNYIFNS